MSVQASPRRVAPAARMFVASAAVFVAAAGLSLFLLSEKTSLYFAWTIKPPVTAAFLGGGYLAVTTALALALREQDWARIRIGVWVVGTGLTSILIATLLHLDKFHLNSPVWTAQAWAWTWLALYIVLIPGLIAALWLQRRETGEEAPPRAALDTWLRLGMALLALVMLVVGLALFTRPDLAASLWPWPLTPLTARMIGAFYIGFAVSLVVAAKENDYTRTYVAAAAYIVFAILQGVTFMRYPAVSWMEPAGLLLAGVLAALLVIGVTSLRGHLIHNQKS